MENFQNIDIINLTCNNENNLFDIQIYLEKDNIYFLYKNKNEKYYQKKLFDFNELEIINNFFSIFDNIEEIFKSIKDIINNSKLYKKNPTIIKKENEFYFIIYPNIGKYEFIEFPLNPKSEIKMVKINENFLKKFEEIEEDIKNVDLIVENYEKKISTLNQRIEELNLIIDNYKTNILNNCHYYNNNNSFENYILINSEHEPIIIKELLISDGNFYSIFSQYKNKKVNFLLLYKAKKDGDKTQTFHKKVDGKGPLIVLVKTSNKLIIGGYTSKPWSSSDKNVEDSEAFLFSLKKKKIYNILNEKFACFHSKCDGPTFGYDCELKIVNECFLNESISNNNLVNKTYNFNKHNLLDGKTRSFFKILDYEVYQVIIDN